MLTEQITETVGERRQLACHCGEVRQLCHYDDGKIASLQVKIPTLQVLAALLQVNCSRAATGVVILLTVIRNSLFND